MKVYKDGMTLIRDTGSITNALMENKPIKIKVGDTFVELLWSDRTAYIVTRVNNQRDFYAKRIKVEMKDWTEGTQYPLKDEKGAYITEGVEFRFRKPRKYWYCGSGKVHLSWGEDCGYRDPSF